jgi:hypothetical protein
MGLLKYWQGRGYIEGAGTVVSPTKLQKKTHQEQHYVKIAPKKLTRLETLLGIDLSDCTYIDVFYIT